MHPDTTLFKQVIQESGRYNLAGLNYVIRAYGNGKQCDQGVRLLTAVVNALDNRSMWLKKFAFTVYLPAIVYFDLDITELASMSGERRSHHCQKLLESLPQQIITQAATLIDQDGIIFGWVFPELLSTDEHVRSIQFCFSDTNIA
jgi:hypothetical protein